MWVMRLILIIGLIGQLLWAQGSIALAPPCQSPPRAAVVQAPPPSTAGMCCRSRAAEAPATAKGCCGGRGDAARPAPSERPEPPAACARAAETSAGCDPANCCKRVPPPRPRPVDRIPAPEKRPTVLMPALAPASPVILVNAAVGGAIRPAAVSGSNNARRATLCVWRN
jgi:hypothetical protein